MNAKDQIKQQEEQVRKVIAFHGFDWKGIEYVLHSLLVLKGLQDGQNDPYKFASDMLNTINKAKT